MTDIRLIRLTLEHFKGIPTLTLQADGHNITIYGDNATGKSTVFDAWAWLLTGKDSRGRVAADSGGFCVKPLDQAGEVADRAAISSVEAVLAVGDRELILRKSYYEKWTEKRGSAEASYDGNTTDYYINDVPKSKRQYDAEIAELVPDKLLRLLSDGAAFPTLHWQERRDILFDLAKIGDDGEIMARDAQFAPLAEATRGMTLDDYRKQLTAQRRKCNETRKAIPARLDELQKTADSLSGLPYGDLRQSVTDLEAEQQRLTASLEAARGDEVRWLENERARLRNELDRLELENQRYRTSQVTGTRSVEQLQSDLSHAKLAYSYESERYHSARRDAERYARQVEESRRRWSELRGKAYPGNAICPTCGQPLPPDKQADARKCWEEERDNQLRRTGEEGQRQKQAQARAEAQAEAQKEAMIQCEGRIARCQEELDAARQEGEPVVTDMEGYAADRAALAARLADTERTLETARRDTDAHRRQLEGQQRTVNQELSALREQLAKEGVLRRTRERMEELKEQARQLSGQMAECDRMLDLSDRFLRYKTDCITEEVNSCFRLARFRLFTAQVNGGLNPCCDILCGGVPYDGGLNNGARIAVGLDIIDTLSRHYGIRLPVWVDNAESVTALPELEHQVIRLVVSEHDKEVRIAS